MIGAPRLRVGLRAVALEAGSGAGGPGAAGLNRADEQAGTGGARSGLVEVPAESKGFGKRGPVAVELPGAAGRALPAGLPPRQVGESSSTGRQQGSASSPSGLLGRTEAGAWGGAEGPQVLRGVPAGAAWHPCPGFTPVGAVPDQVLG